MGTPLASMSDLVGEFFLYAACQIPLSPSGVTSSQTRVIFFFFLLELHLRARAPVTFWETTPPYGWVAPTISQHLKLAVGMLL